jgi:hypothetical protein
MGPRAASQGQSPRSQSRQGHRGRATTRPRQGRRVRMAIHRYMTFEERFWAQVEKTDGCWLWTGNKDRDGYGHIKHGGKSIGAHRASYLIHNGEIPEGQVICHTCDNPACVRPDHIFSGTVADNNRDRDEKGRSASGDRNASRLYPERRPRGENHHWQTKPWTRMTGEKNGRAKLTQETANEIRAKWETGQYTKRALSCLYGVSDVQIGKIVNNLIWTGGE